MSLFDKPAHLGGSSSLLYSLRSAINTIYYYIRLFIRNDDSRQIFYFLCLNLSYMVVQLLYGFWSNSLGLISDAIHMFFDCLALGAGLVAAVMAKWPPNERFSFGYARVEVLAGFSNAVFLVLISMSILVEAIQRLLDPPEMKTDSLLVISFLGLVVNLIGIVAFNHGHAHSHHGHDHGHDHHHHHHHHNANMHGVFLHILADTMGSVGVIISTLLIQYTGWTGFDPIASIVIAVLIFASVVPLLKHTGSVLLLQTEAGMVNSIQMALNEISKIDGVISYSVPHFFPVDEHHTHGVIHVQTTSKADVTFVLARVHDICRQYVHVTEMTVQIEPESSGWKGCSCTSDKWKHERQLVDGMGRAGQVVIGTPEHDHHHHHGHDHDHDDHHHHGHGHHHHGGHSHSVSSNSVALRM
jgi:zinc transporter 5/7